MNRINKKKESKITYKTHHKHQPIQKDELKQMQGGITRYQTTRILPRKEKGKGH